ncbi:hypothetical protein B0H13DRAFT_2195423 [Mycena leptocephala]|nr:hypothetical protein B0H13DRAFT_2195423 [Mycena leptocephala]
MYASRCSECGAPSSGSAETFDVTVTPGTRHHTLLNSNEPPQESELTFICSAISKADARLACLEDEISNLRKTLQQLEADHTSESLSSYRTKHKVILFPLRRMPPEVLSEIFLWTLPSIQAFIGHSSCGRFDMRVSSWILTRICTRWRAISISFLRCGPELSSIMAQHLHIRCPWSRLKSSAPRN